MSWRWLCVQRVLNPLQEFLNQAGASLDLKEAVYTDSSQRETRKSGLNQGKCSFRMSSPCAVVQIWMGCVMRAELLL